VALGDSAARRRLRQHAERKAYEIAESVRTNGGGFMGMRRVLRQPRESAPQTRAPRVGIKPNVAGKNKWARIEALQVLKSFVTRYVEARSGVSSRHVFDGAALWCVRCASFGLITTQFSPQQVSRVLARVRWFGGEWG
jgi:hypothetical protein